MNLPNFRKFLRLFPIANIVGAIAFMTLLATFVRLLVKNRNAIIETQIFEYAGGILLVVTLVVTAGTFIFNYLSEEQVKGSKKNVNIIYSDEVLKSALSSTVREIADIKSILSNVHFAENISKEDKEKLFTTIANSISKDINTEFLKTIEDKYSESIISELKYKQILENFTSLTDRLDKEIYGLSRRANLNLFIGICTTAMAVFVLFASVYFKNLEIKDWKGVIEYFAPRISITIFIEIFSFFFLKLYRASLSDIKYYQNELTNIDFKILALKSALLMNDKKSIEKIIQEFIKVERNFILKKGETTVEIEAFKNSNQYDESFSGVVKNLLDKLNHNTVKVKPKKTKKADLEG